MQNRSIFVCAKLFLTLMCVGRGEKLLFYFIYSSYFTYFYLFFQGNLVSNLYYYFTL